MPSLSMLRVIAEKSMKLLDLGIKRSVPMWPVLNWAKQRDCCLWIYSGRFSSFISLCRSSFHHPVTALSGAECAAGITTSARDERCLETCKSIVWTLRLMLAVRLLLFLSMMRIPRPKAWIIGAAATFFMAPTTVYARDVSGVTLSEAVSVNGRELNLNGTGVGKEKLLFDVYVIGLYLETRTADAVAAIKADEGKRIVL